jgi:hypothetical protein
LSQKELIHLIDLIDKRKNGRGKNTGSQEPVNSSAQQTAKVVGTSESTVKRVRSIMDHADEDIKEAVKSGEMPISTGYDITQEKRKHTETKATFNITNENIECYVYK